MRYQLLLQQRADAINALDPITRSLVLDALRVRAMDFVGDRLASDHGDMVADVVRTVDPTADARELFAPATYYTASVR